MISFRLPDVGEGVAEAEIVQWLVRVGDQVERDQVVVEVQTDKAVVELPSPSSGVIQEICYQVREVVPVGEVLFTLLPVKSDNHQIQSADSDEKSIIQSMNHFSSEEPKILVHKECRRLASPAIRRRARQLGIDLQEVSGTGPRGRITQSDLEQHLSDRELVISSSSLNGSKSIDSSEPRLNVSSVLPQAETVPLTPIRKVIAKRLLFSTTTKPHATHMDQLDVSGLVAWRSQHKNKYKKNYSYTSILLKMISYTLQKHPKFNSHFAEDQQQITTFPSISLGIATDTPKGLLVPVLHRVEEKSIHELAHESTELILQARAGQLTPKQMTHSTFTISNAGTLGGQWATPIIQPPEVAILAIHPIQQQPIVNEEGELDIGWRMNVSLSFDHRVLDGADAIRFTQTLQEITKDPSCLLSELR